ncbi:RNA polymerase sigma factor [Baekduia soli]|nr:sigma-70 family RNA polymerase sigma factor [Baekduia soli]
MTTRTCRAPFDWTALRDLAHREARRVVRDDFDADEAAQEAVLRAWRGQASCRADDPRPWMAQIARREALRLLARRREDRSTAADDLDERASSDGQDELSALRIDLARALGDLDRRDRALLYARYALDLTQPAAAAVLDMPEGTAKVRLHRLRARLAESLAA